MEKVWFRPIEASEYLCCGLSTIYWYHSQGKLPIKKVSPRVSLIHIDDMNRLIGVEPGNEDGT